VTALKEFAVINLTRPITASDPLVRLESARVRPVRDMKFFFVSTDG
jgi:hypothetical protein